MSLVSEAPLCSVCGAVSVFFPDSGHLYQGGVGYGPVYQCDSGHEVAYVGCHRGTTTPLGTPAVKVVRLARSRAHKAFDPLWKAKQERAPKGQKRAARALGYQWLADQLGLAGDECHIGLFDEAQCKRVVEICTPYTKKLRTS